MGGPRAYSEGTKAALAALSQGSCYFPGCMANLVVVREDGEAYIEYEISHIYDAKPGNRYRQDMTDDGRRAFANLILLCRSHHEEVDSRHPERFPAATLLEWKASKESGNAAALNSIGTITESELAASLASAAIRVTNSIINLGGQGGQAPGAGGGGGAAIGPNAVGGKGGDGGDFVEATIPVTPGEVLEFEVGEGGTLGQPGGDTIVRRINQDGTKTELVRARGGGRKGFDSKSVPLHLSSGLLANHAEVQNGLLYVLGGGWDHWPAPELPAHLSVAVVLVFEPATRSAGGGDIKVTLLDPEGLSRIDASLWVEFGTNEDPLRLARIFYFNYSVDQSGVWTFEIQCNSSAIAQIPLLVLSA